MKHKLYIIIALLLPPLLTTAARDTVYVSASCVEGTAFTIRIPVKLQGMSVEYVWYRNDTVVEENPLTAGVTTIAYTIPANKAYGSSAFHFKYRLNDGCNEWTASKMYVMTFESYISCILEPGDVDSEGITVTEPIPYSPCIFEPGDINDEGITVIEFEPHCNLDPGDVNSGEGITVTEPIPYPPCIFEPGDINDEGITAIEFEPHCNLDPGDVNSGEGITVTEPIPYPPCIFEPGDIDSNGIDVVIAVNYQANSINFQLL